MTSTKRRLLLIAMTAALVIALSTAGIISAYAVTAEDTIEYPFTKGADAFKSAPTWGVPTQGEDSYVRLEVHFPEVAVSEVDYLAMQIKVNNPTNLTVGAISSGGVWVDTDGIGWKAEGNPFYMVKEDGTIQQFAVHNGGVEVGSNSGMLLLPMSSLVWRGTEGNLKHFLFTTNYKYNFNFQLTVGEVGYYTGDPADGGVYHSLLKPTLNEEDHDSYTDAEKTANWGVFGGEIAYPSLAKYPFATGSDALKFAPTWTNKADAEGMPSLKTPTMSSIELSKVKSVAIQVKSTDAVRMVIGALNGNKRIDTKSATGQKLTFVSENGTKEELTVGENGYIGVQGTGAIVIPAELLTGDTMTSLNQMIFETSSANFSVVVGEIGYYDTSDVYHSLYQIPNLADTAYNDKVITGLYEKLFVAENSTVTHPTAPQETLKSAAAKATYGDAKIYWQVKATDNYVADASGASGTATIVKDSYGMDAVQIQATANDKNGYMAMNFMSVNIALEGTRGVTLWAKNTTDKEIYFNVEMDVKYRQAEGNPKYHRARLNITQGNRFWLYDVNTDVQSIYMTRPTCTLPAGFEGWVRIPFTCFNKADWSKGNPMTVAFDNGVAKADTFITYFGISYAVKEGAPINSPFVLNNFGTYTTTPMYNSVLVNNADKTIPALMDNLPALPEANKEDK